jgi:hypothetical protein
MTWAFPSSWWLLPQAVGRTSLLKTVSRVGKALVCVGRFLPCMSATRDSLPGGWPPRAGGGEVQRWVRGGLWNVPEVESCLPMW